MADDRDITEILYDIKLKGQNEAFRSFKNLEGMVDKTLASLEDLGTDNSLGTLATRTELLTSHTTNLARALGGSQTAFNVMGKNGRIIERISKLTTAQTADIKELGEAQTQRNDALVKEIHERMKLREKEIKLETTKGVKVLAQEKKIAQEIYEIRKKGLKGLAAGGAAGGAEIWGALKNQDISSTLKTLGSGSKGLGRYMQGAGGERVGRARGKLENAGVTNVTQAGGVRGQIANAGKFIKSGAGGEFAMGQMLLTVGKLATAATAVVGVFALIAKVLYDAYAQAKKFNGEILKTQGITALMPTHMIGTAEGLALAETRLRSIRDLSTNFQSNFELDLKPDDMFALANALDEAGLPASRLRDYAADLRVMLEADQIAAKNLGVGLSDVTGFTASYMDTLDADLEQVRSTLAYITDDAQKSGMSTKKFFQIIQNASGDMAMYNYRISEASTLLKGISKYMDSKSAEEFMTNMSKGLTQMSQTDRLKTLSLASGGKVGKFKKPLQQEADQALTELSADQRGEAISRLKSMGIDADNTNLNQKLLDLDSSQLGGMSGVSGYSQIEKANLMNKNASKGALGIAAAAGDAGPMFQVEALMKAAEAVGSIEDVTDVIGTQLVGGDEKKFRMMRSFAIQTRGQKDRLTGAAAKSPEELERVQKEMGFEGLTRSKDGKLLGKDGKEITSEFDLLRNGGEKSQTDLARLQEQQKTSAEKTVELTKNILDAIELGMTAVLEDIYGAVVDIRNLIMGEGASEETKRKSANDKKAGKIRREMGKTTDPKRAAKLQEELQNLEVEKGLEMSYAMRPDERGNMSIVPANEKMGMSGGLGTLARNILEEVGMADGLKSTIMESGAEFTFFKSLGLEFASMGAVLKDGKVTEDEMKSLQDESVRLLGAKGIRIDPTILQELSKKIAMEGVIAQQASAFSKKTGLGMEESMSVLRSAYSTGSVPDMKDKNSAVRGALKDLNIPIAGDVRMVTSGIPLLNMKAGDMVLDSSSLASTSYGAAGGLLRPNSGGAPSGAGASSVFAPVIHMGGSGDENLKNKLYKMLEEFHRREVLGSG